MNDDERVAEGYLKTLGFSSIEYEPIPNETPDFLCDGVAVEVRRVAQYGPDKAPLASLDVSLYRLIKQIISAIPVDAGGHSYFITHRFSRPLDLRPHKKPIKDGFKNFGNPSAKSVVYKASGISIEATPAGGALQTKFRFGIISDDDSGGWLGEIFESATMIAVGEKVGKIKINQALYDSWWLVLVDHVGLLAEPECDRLSKLAVGHSFEKIIFIDPHKKWAPWEATHLIK